MQKDSKILIVGHNDIMENALYEHFQSNGFSQVFSSSRMALDASIQPSVYGFFQEQRPEYVFLGSTRSGGIQANIQYPGEFIYHNLASQSNILYSSWKFGVKKLLYFASSCVYPQNASQPIKEISLLSGDLEKTSEFYAVSKIAGLKLCEAFKKQYGFNAITAIPATLYGPGSDVDLEKAHVMGALISKICQAAASGQREVSVWGTGEPRREFLYIDDFVGASLFLMENYEGNETVNIGCGSDVSIKVLAETIAEVVAFKGQITFDAAKPNGVMKKLLDNAKISRMGWSAKVTLREGIARTIKWFQGLSLSGQAVRS